MELNTADVITIQIPEYLLDEGPVLSQFIKAYYEWLESSIYGNDIELLKLRDIDETIDEFTQYFKETYLANLPSLDPTRVRLLVKHIKDFYNTRGSERSFELLFNLLYGLEATVYNPGKDILIASDGKWYEPVYIETTRTFNAAEYINKTIYGSQSGSSAIVENIVRKNMNGSYFNVIYLTNIDGNFIKGERITYNGSLEDAPVVLGSLNEIDIIEGGQDNKIGDIFNIRSDIGKYGKVRVTEIENNTGRVNFNLVDGGSGYTMNAHAVLSSEIFTTDQSTETFLVFEGVYQTTSNLTFLSASGGNFEVGDIVEGYTTGTNVFQGNGVVVLAEQQGSEGTLKIVHHDDYTDFDFADIIVKVGNSVTAVIDTVQDTTATANVVGVSDNRVGVYNTNNYFYISGPITGILSNTRLTITGQGTGSGANFSVGSLTGEETVWINTDLIGGVNIVETPYLEIKVTGEGSGVGFLEDVIIEDGGSGYSNGDFLSIVGGGYNIGSVNIIDGGTNYANGERLIVLSDVGRGATGSVTTNGSGEIVDVTIGNPGRGYIDTPILTVNTAIGTGAILEAISMPYVNAEVEIFTDGSGTITSANVVNIGDGFYTTPTLFAPGGSDANLIPVMDWGYGFPKLPQGDLSHIIYECLTTETVVIGTIASLSSISPGQGYNQDPFVLVVEPFTAAMNRKDLILYLSNTSSSFTVGEIVNQNITEQANELTFTINSGPGFEIGEVLQQGSTSGVVYYREPTLVRVNQIINGPFQSSDTAEGSVSGTNINVNTVTPIPYASVAKGIVRSFDGEKLILKRVSFNTTFNQQFSIYGMASGSTANVTQVIQDDNSLSMGNNAIVTAEVKTANGVATKVTLIDSGFGYVDDYEVVLENPDNPYVIRGLTEVNFQGISEGYWLNTDGFLNSDKYLHDGDYYQSFSYEVQVGLSLDRYSDIIKKLLHTAGTKMFGKYIFVTTETVTPLIESTITDNIKTFSIVQSDVISLLGAPLTITPSIIGEADNIKWTSSKYYNLPDWASIDEDTGEITGVPTSVGTTNVTIIASSDDYITNKTFLITIE